MAVRMVSACFALGSKLASVNKDLKVEAKHLYQFISCFNFYICHVIQRLDEFPSDQRGLMQYILDAVINAR